MNYKIRIYNTYGNNKGNLSHEELFATFEKMTIRYKELYKKELGVYNATAWEYTEKIESGINWGINWHRISDTKMYNAMKEI